jgi:hypothetical protein
MSVTFAELHTMMQARPKRPGAPVKSPAFLAPDENRLWTHLMTWRNNKPVAHPRQVFYAASYGAEQATLTRKAVTQMSKGEHPATHLGALTNSDVRVYEMDLDASYAALSENEAAHAVSYGLLAVEEGTDLLLLGTLSVGAAEAITALNKKIGQAKAENVFVLFAASGGVDLCAALGAAMAARMANVPVIADQALANLLHAAISLLCDNADESPVIAAWEGALRFDAAVQPLMSWHHLKGLIALMPARPALTTLSHAA